jgi:hypothetical protein
MEELLAHALWQRQSRVLLQRHSAPGTVTASFRTPAVDEVLADLIDRRENGELAAKDRHIILHRGGPLRRVGSEKLKMVMPRSG